MKIYGSIKDCIKGIIDKKHKKEKENKKKQKILKKQLSMQVKEKNLKTIEDEKVKQEEMNAKLEEMPEGKEKDELQNKIIEKQLAMIQLEESK